MQGLGLRMGAIAALTIATLTYVFPWNLVGIELPFTVHEYKLGLDLHGGVELDYKVDVEEGKAKKGADFNEKDAVEGLKSIVEKRVNSLGTAEPTIQTATYGNEQHIIVQIPTQNLSSENLSEEEKAAKSQEYIAKAKDTIGKVVRLEFKEEKRTITEEDRLERKTIAEKALSDVKGGMAFKTVGLKYRDSYENAEYFSGTGTKDELPPEVIFSGISNVNTGALTGIVETQKGTSMTVGDDGKLKTIDGDKGYTIVKIDSVKKVEREKAVAGTGTGETKKEKVQVNEYVYEAIFISQKPSEWTIAKTADGKALDEGYLTKASVSFNQGLQPQVDLLFNSEGAKIFGELTKRLIKERIAIFVGGQLLTAPTVQSVIPDGRAVITGNYSAEEAKRLANDINTGIVPAPIYLTSERTIDAKIGADSLDVIVRAGIIGLIAIIVFLVLIYRVSGLLAGVALILYGIFLLALVKFFGIVLTLASIAGLILSIGLAIDANILIFERTKEALREGSDLTKATVIGFSKSWTAIWDSHITSLTSAIILFIFGINLIKGFGLMLGLGIVLSLFTAMWVSRILILYFGQYFGKDLTTFIGHKK